MNNHEQKICAEQVMQNDVPNGSEGGGIQEGATVPDDLGWRLYVTCSATRGDTTPSDTTPGEARRDGETTQKAMATRATAESRPVAQRTVAEIYIYIYIYYRQYVYIYKLL